jgi:hypothetical protein
MLRSRVLIGRSTLLAVVLALVMLSSGCASPTAPSPAKLRSQLVAIGPGDAGLRAGEEQYCAHYPLSYVRSQAYAYGIYLTGTGNEVWEELARYTSAEAAVRSVLDDLHRCSTFTVTLGNGRQLHGSVRAVPSTFGKSTWAFEVSEDGVGGWPPLIIAERGNVLMSLEIASDVNMAGIVHKALAKIRQDGR